MADIFVSYARQDRERVAPLVAALAAQGFSVWWDPEITPGQEFDRLITAELRVALAVIVVWTPASVESRWVRGEARIAAERGVLVPVRFDTATLPIDAMAMHTTDLDDWKGSPSHAGFQGLVRALRTLVARTSLANQSASAAPTPVAAAPSSQVARAQARFGVSSKQLVPALAIALTVIAALALLLIHRSTAPQSAIRAAPQSASTAQPSSTPVASMSSPMLRPSPSKPRIAVMPFENFSPDPANAFFTDGMHEEVLTALANSAPGLEVISRTTMNSYKGKPVTVAQLEKDLACTHVLEGSVRREGDHVRLTLQLINATTDEHVWAQDYDRTLKDSLTLQSEVADEVAKQLQVQLAGGPGADSAPTKNPEAYDLYLKAKLAMQASNAVLGNAEVTKIARDVQSLLTQAIAADPTFGLAYLARAQAHYFEAQINAPPFAGVLSEETLRPAREDLSAAVRLLGANDARVITVRTLIDTNTTPEKSLAAIDTADAAHVSDADVLSVKARTYAALGRSSESIEIMKGLVALDPANFDHLFAYQVILQAAHKPAEALKVLDLMISRPGAPPLIPILRGRLILEWTGDPGPLKAAIDEFGARVDPAVLLNFKGDLLRYTHRFTELKSLVLASRATGVRYFVAGAPISANLPVTFLQGFAALLTGDKALGKAAGEAVIKGIDSVAANLDRVTVLASESEGNTFAGNKARALDLAWQASNASSSWSSKINQRVLGIGLAVTFAWSGGEDEAIDILEQSSTSDWGLTPAEIARDPVFAIPLANNARYQALKAKLEAQMAANVTLLNVSGP